MIILIDGYNILKHLHGSSFIEPAVRDAFAIQLNMYGKRKGHAIHLVFDGGPYDMTTSERHGVVTVVFAGMRETADDYIKRYIEKHKHRQLLLVTHDRELVDYAHRRDVPTIDVWPFYQFVQEGTTAQSADTNANNSSQAHKLHPDEVDVHLDTLLEGVVVPHVMKVASKAPEARLPRKALSKRERRLAKIVKKL